MAKSSIKPGEQSQAAASTEIVPASSQLPVPAENHERYDDGSRDRIIPRLGLVNATGPLAKKFRSDFGKFVYDNRLVLTNPQIIGVKLQKFYVEQKRGGVDLKFEDEKKTFPTAAAAHAAGYAVDFDSNHPNKVEEAGNILLLVSGPEDDPSGDFFIKIGDKFYAPAAFTVRRGGYRNVYRRLFTAEDKAALRGGRLWETVWALASEEVSSTKNDNVWVEPRIDVKSKLTAEERASLEAIIGRYVNLPQAAE